MGTSGLILPLPCYSPYACCQYACAFVAFDFGIISTYPTTIHPKPSDTNKSKGRIKKARQGGASDIEG
jgi:hypothetical protein